MIRSVLGAVPGDVIGAVLPHEHVLHRLAGGEAPPVSSADASVRVEELQLFRCDPWLRGGVNLRLEKEDDAFRELEPLLELAPGDARPLVVDVTLPRDARDEFTSKRVQLAEKLGIHLVMSTTYDAQIWGGGDDESERIAKTLETELVFGIGATEVAGAQNPEASGVCAGVIYQHIRASGTNLDPHELILARGLALVSDVYLQLLHEDCVVLNHAIDRYTGSTANARASVPLVPIRP
jgi:predicted metal-dependent phosphotriesterase family hydrolase